VKLYARVSPFSRASLLGETIRLATALNYVTRMRRAGVPEKRIRRIEARWLPWPWACRREMAALIEDMRGPR
jgi:hypothetical protein